MKFKFKRMILFCLAISPMRAGASAACKPSGAAKIDTQAAISHQKENTEHFFNLPQEYPVLRQLRLQLASNRPFFDAWIDVGDKGLVFKAVFNEHESVKLNWIQRFGFNLYYELNKLYQTVKQTINSDDRMYIEQELNQLKKRTQPEPQKPAISLANLSIDGVPVMDIVKVAEGYENLQLIVIQTIGEITRQNQKNEINTELMKDAFTRLKKWFLTSALFTRFYSQDAQERDEQKKLLAQILDAHINSAEKITEAQK